MHTYEILLYYYKLRWHGKGRFGIHRCLKFTEKSALNCCTINVISFAIKEGTSADSCLFYHSFQQLRSYKDTVYGF